MFGMSFTEILVIAVLALVLLGPDQLPDAARKLGKVLREVKQATDGVKTELAGQLDAAGASDRARTALGELGALRKAAADTTALLSRELLGAPGPVARPAPPAGSPTPVAAGAPQAPSQEPASAPAFRQVSLADLAALDAPAPPAPPPPLARAPAAAPSCAAGPSSAPAAASGCADAGGAPPPEGSPS